MRKKKTHHTFLGGKKRRRHLRFQGRLNREQRLVSICAWCPDHREQTESARAHGFDVSHGICQACLEKHFPGGHV